MSSYCVCSVQTTDIAQLLCDARQSSAAAAVAAAAHSVVFQLFRGAFLDHGDTSPFKHAHPEFSHGIEGCHDAAVQEIGDTRAGFQFLLAVAQALLAPVTSNGGPDILKERSSPDDPLLPSASTPRPSPSSSRPPLASRSDRTYKPPRSQQPKLTRPALPIFFLPIVRGK